MAHWPVVATTVVLGACAVPIATADPGSLPDLSGYTTAEPDGYSTYYDYPTTGGAQFVTPGGYRCRITYTGRANPAFKAAICWGSLPGTPSNYVGVSAALDAGPAKFSNGDLAELEKYRKPPGDSAPVTVSPDAYKPLPVGSKLTYPGSATCAVADAMTVCVLGDHGFVLKADGSQAF
jgi:hypothetical protein